MVAASTKSTATPVLVMKSVKLSPAALPIIILGGSPIRVAVPPMLEAMIWVMKKGMGLIRSMLVMARVMGPMRSTVVTLSRKADKTAVIKANNTISGQGRPLAIFAALMAMYSKMPEFLTTATKSIMPIRTPRVLRST